MSEIKDDAIKFLEKQIKQLDEQNKEHWKTRIEYENKIEKYQKVINEIQNEVISGLKYYDYTKYGVTYTTLPTVTLKLQKIYSIISKLDEEKK
jgi:hypothetical protein